ncbi:hypothetical protein [Undibacterium sp. Di27W]|uniref:hypothetical protein n=1 Tax=Undibacterium sp. Di27W TaxID=3413036 RepID=UPI003BF56A4B
MTPEEQWEKTVLYVKKNKLNKASDWQHWLRSYEYLNRNYRRLNDKMLKELWMNSQLDSNLTINETCGQLAIVVRPHRFFLVGDILFADGGIGGQNDRIVAVSGVSSKGIKLNRFYTRFSDLYPKGIVEYRHVPGDLIGCQWDDQSLCRFVDTLRVR